MKYSNHVYRIDSSDSKSDLDIFLDIEVEAMHCFAQPLTILYIRDVTETINQMILGKKHQNVKDKLERVKLSTETLSHEMRAPLSSMVMIMEILLGMGKVPVNTKRVRKYHKQIKN